MSDNTVCRAKQLNGDCLCDECKSYDASKWVVAPEMTREQAIRIIMEETSNGYDLALKHYELMSETGWVE